MKKSMKNLIKSLTLATCVLSLAGCSIANKTTNTNTNNINDVLKNENYNLVFSDDFDGDKLDRTKWRVGYNTPDRRVGFYEDSEDTVFVKDGNLVIRTSYKKDGQYGEGWYTSWVESCTDKNKGHTQTPDNFKGFAGKYGYYEIRCKVPKTKGIWSAFWLMPNENVGMTKDDIIGTGSDGVEIDVMESPWYYKMFKKNTNQHVLHGDGYTLNKTETSPMLKVPNMYDEFHTYGVLWNEEEYIFYIDGKETWRTKHSVDGEELGVSQVEEYLLMTVEVAGYKDEDGNFHVGKELIDGKEKNNWCGNPSSNNKTKSYDFVIDYVKVYQK